MNDIKQITRWSWLSLILLLMITSLAMAEPTYESVGETAFNFGKVDQGENATHVFKFKNTGTDTLEILNVKAG